MRGSNALAIARIVLLWVAAIFVLFPDRKSVV